MATIKMKSNLNCWVFLILIHVTIAQAKPHHDELLDFNLHPHIHLEQFHHHIRVRNVLLGILGTIAVVVGGFLVYRYYSTGRGGLDTTFSERGTLLPANSFIPEPSFRKRWPINLLNQCGVSFARFPTLPRVPIPVVYYNRTANPDKATYDPWEQL